MFWDLWFSKFLLLLCMLLVDINSFSTINILLYETWVLVNVYFSYGSNLIIMNYAVYACVVIIEIASHVCQFSVGLSWRAVSDHGGKDSSHIWWPRYKKIPVKWLAHSGLRNHDLGWNGHSVNPFVFAFWELSYLAYRLEYIFRDESWTALLGLKSQRNWSSKRFVASPLVYHGYCECMMP